MQQYIKDPVNSEFVIEGKAFLSREAHLKIVIFHEQFPWWSPMAKC